MCNCAIGATSSKCDARHPLHPVHAHPHLLVCPTRLFAHPCPPCCCAVCVPCCSTLLLPMCHTCSCPPAGHPPVRTHLPPSLIAAHHHHPHHTHCLARCPNTIEPTSAQAREHAGCCVCMCEHACLLALSPCPAHLAIAQSVHPPSLHHTLTHSRLVTHPTSHLLHPPSPIHLLSCSLPLTALHCHIE